ncbi:phenylalanine ammonia-lyase [Calocera viscosa TUFC12733]|uniref:Phenylalanine ammonia-lyase n=1 Tax=Calocera viscosa (strain TUFC12733) TaxID=1330018 RepID=A0A167LXJ1_CALVF|nr:phenylalanine ammonia-lyase [Calocera viscosa TUFC12733]
MLVLAAESAAPGAPKGAWDHPAVVQVNGTHSNSAHILPKRDATLLSVFLDTFDRLSAHLCVLSSESESGKSVREGKPVQVDGYSLAIADVVAAARYGALLELSAGARGKVDKSERAIQGKLDTGKSVYGISTGYGGSADTRTHQYLALGKSLLQHQHCGVLPSSPSASPSSHAPLPLIDPLAGTSMPESWVRAAIAIRTNSLIRGHSGVQWQTVEAMSQLLNSGVTPLVPLRGSISASGDLQPLSYVAGTLIGNPGVRCFSGPAGQRTILPAPQALAAAGLQPHTFSAKDHLGILNGTAFSAAVASLALYDAAHLTLLAQVCTAMGTEALKGVQASHHPFIHAVTRPHPGQVEAAQNMWLLMEGSRLAVGGEEKEVSLEEDRGTLRQDRYSLRTSPQWIGPQVEDVLSAWGSVTQECNSRRCGTVLMRGTPATDNPLVDGETGSVHHGGNFQAMAVTNAMEKTRLSLHHLGKLMFAQSTELLNPGMNRGLPPNMAGTDPSLNYHCKGLDIASAAYVSELGFLANPVSTHVQSAELHNQAVNSLALISARKTVEALDVLTMLMASYIYILCQALDLRAQQFHLAAQMRSLLVQGLIKHFGEHVARELGDSLFELVSDRFDSTSSMDAAPRMDTIFSYCTTPLVDHFLSQGAVEEVRKIPAFRTELARSSLAAYTVLREQFLDAQYGATPASEWLAPRTRRLYEFVRVGLGIAHHGVDNAHEFEHGFEGGTIGHSVSRIYEAIGDGRMHAVVVDIFRLGLQQHEPFAARERSASGLKRAPCHPRHSPRPSVREAASQKSKIRVEPSPHATPSAVVGIVIRWVTNLRRRAWDCALCANPEVAVLPSEVVSAGRGEQRAWLTTAGRVEVEQRSRPFVLPPPPRTRSGAAMAPTAELIFHGTGTSSCLPNIACLTTPPEEPRCEVCFLGANPGRGPEVGLTPEEALRNRRRNTGAIYRYRPEGEGGEETVIVIDAGKSFVQAAIEWCALICLWEGQARLTRSRFPKYGLRRIDGLLLTHAHADAMNGLDDLRCWTLRGAIQAHIDIYLSPRTFAEVQRTFPYLVDKGMATGGGDVPDFLWHVISDFEPVDIGGVHVVPLLVHHGRYFEPQSTLALGSPLPTRPDTPAFPSSPTTPPSRLNGLGLGASFPFPNPIPKALFAKPTATSVAYPSLGFLLPQFLYLSDVSELPPPTLQFLASLPAAEQPKVLVIDCLRPKPHMSHFGLAQSVSAISQLALPRNYLIGMTCGHGSEWITHRGWEQVCAALSSGAQTLDKHTWVGEEQERVRCEAALEEVRDAGVKGGRWVRPCFDGMRIVVGEQGVSDGVY